MNDRLELWISTPIYTCYIVVINGAIVKAAPIMHWAVGKPWKEVLEYLKRRFGQGFQYQRL